MNETKLMTILEQMTDSNGRVFVKDKKAEFLSNYSMWHRDEGKQLIQKFVRIVNRESTESFSWLEILNHSNIKEKSKRFDPILKNKKRNINMHYQIPEQFHGDIDQAILFHCMENPRGYVDDCEMDEWSESKNDSPTIEDYYLESERKRKNNEGNEISKILELRHEYVQNKSNLEELITNIIYSDESELKRELNHMFNSNKFDFTKKYVLKGNDNNKHEVLGYYYLSSYYYQLLQEDKFDLSRYDIGIDSSNEKNRQKSMEMAEGICNIEAYPFSCSNPKLGKGGVGEYLITKSDISHFGVLVVLRRIYRYLIEKNKCRKTKKPIFIFRKYKGVWELLFKEVVDCKEIIDYLEKNYFFCQLSQQGGGITSNNVCSIAKYKQFEKSKESAFNKIVKQFSNNRI